MRKGFIGFFLVAAMVFAAVASAETLPTTVTLMSEGTGTGTAYRVDRFPVKTVFAGHVSGGSYANYSGIFVLQCSPNNTTWTTCKDVGQNAVTKTHDLTAAGVVFNLDDLTQYVRAVFTATSGAAKNKITVIMTYGKKLVSQ